MNPLIWLAEARISRLLGDCSRVGDSRLFSEAAIELYDLDVDRSPAETLYALACDPEKKEALKGWLLGTIYFCCRMTPDQWRQGIERSELRLANIAFELAGLFYEDCSLKEKADLRTGLLHVWADHLIWRQYAGKVAQAFGLSGWVDPATTAEESLLQITPGDVREIDSKLREIKSLADSDYPEPMRNYCIFRYICYLAEKCGNSNGSEEFPAWRIVLERILGEVNSSWRLRNVFLLDYTFECAKNFAGKAWENINALSISTKFDAEIRSEVEAGQVPRESHPRPLLTNAYVAPVTEAEKRIVQVWQELLGVEPVGIHDNFFDLGGNSLMTIRVISRLNSELGVSVYEVSLFEGHTVAALARVLMRVATDAAEESYGDQRSRSEKRRAIRKTSPYPKAG